MYTLTPLISAIQGRIFSKVIQLLTEGSDPKVYGTYQTFKHSKPIIPLIEVFYFFYIEVECMKIVTKMLEAGASPTDIGFHYGDETPIKAAIKFENIPALDLFQSHVGPDVKIFEGEDFVSFAMSNSIGLNVVEYIYEHSPNKKDPIFYFHQACSNNELDTVKFFLTKCEPNATQIGQGLINNLKHKSNLKIRDYLFSLGPDVNYEEKRKTYLHYCTDVDFLRKLIQKGLNVYSEANIGVLRRGDSDRKVAVLKCLLENDIDVYFKYNVGILNDLLKGKEYDLIERLLKNKNWCFLWDSNYMNETPTLYCCYHLRDYEGYWPFVELFHRYGDNINYVNEYGETAASICASRGHLAELKIIVEQWHVDLNRQLHYNKWKDPVEEALTYKRTEVYEYLKNISTPMIIEVD